MSLLISAGPNLPVPPVTSTLDIGARLRRIRTDNSTWAIRQRPERSSTDLHVGVLALSFQLGEVPQFQTFRPDATWREFRFPLNAFPKIDLSRFKAIAIIAVPELGEFSFELDDFQLR